MSYCPVCGSLLELRPCKCEPKPVPFCTKCNDFRFPTFSVAVICAVVNSSSGRLLMLRQYGREKWNLLAGYVNKGEDAETAVVREMWEEVQLKPSSSRFLRSCYWEGSNTLMLAFLCYTGDDDLSGLAAGEVDDARWCSFSEASSLVIPGGVAQQLVAEVPALVRTNANSSGRG